MGVFMADNFKNTAKGMESPPTRHFTITPSDSTDLAIRPRALYCQTGGAIAITDEFGTSITYTVSAGQTLPFRGIRILATGTTATVVGWE